ncbi:MAG: hypothetical protein EOM06_13670, partial [Sphingobacteriia bacterium]|nr:hypothetical protein [Sphingobacteriia bacterium]
MNIKLYLHIGTGKTGTSAIQQFLCDNRIMLAKKFKVLYPDLGSSILLPAKVKGSFNNCKFLNETLGKDDHEKFKNELVKCFLFAVRKKIPTIVLSCESIF